MKSTACVLAPLGLHDDEVLEFLRTTAFDFAQLDLWSHAGVVVVIVATACLSLRIIVEWKAIGEVLENQGSRVLVCLCDYGVLDRASI